MQQKYVEKIYNLCCYFLTTVLITFAEAPNQYKNLFIEINEYSAFD